MQHAVDSKAYLALATARFEMNITGPLLKGILQQPVDNIDYMLVLSIGVFELAHFQQLLKVGDAGSTVGGRASAKNRFCQGVKFEGVFFNLGGVGDHCLNGPARCLL